MLHIASSSALPPPSPQPLPGLIYLFVGPKQPFFLPHAKSICIISRATVPVYVRVCVSVCAGITKLTQHGVGDNQL